MPPNADEALLTRLCVHEETLVEARRLLPIARTRTKPGSGHDIGTLSVGLPAICAYIASNKLHNDDISIETARQASCLKPSDFKKALQLVNVALEAELSPRKRRKEITYDMLHERYNVNMEFSQFTVFLHQAEQALLQLDAPYKPDSPDVRCSIFFWASSIIKVKSLPLLDEFAQDNAILSKRLSPIIKFLNDKCKSLKNKLAETGKSRSRPASPTKPSTLDEVRTPRRTPRKPMRELPTRDSVKKSKTLTSNSAEHRQDEEPMVGSFDHSAMLPETPVKKRKLENSNALAIASASKQVSSSMKHKPNNNLALPLQSTSSAKSAAQNFSVKTGENRPSPLRRSARSVLQEEVDQADDMDIDDALELKTVEVDDDAYIKPMHTRRFRPVYQDHKQWHSCDVRIARLWNETKVHLKEDLPGISSSVRRYS